MIHVAELDSASDPDNIPETQEMKTIAIVGGTGQTGKWAVKGALLRGYKVSGQKLISVHGHEMAILGQNSGEKSRESGQNTRNSV